MDAPIFGDMRADYEGEYVSMATYEVVINDQRVYRVRNQRIELAMRDAARQYRRQYTTPITSIAAKYWAGE